MTARQKQLRAAKRRWYKKHGKAYYRRYYQKHRARIRKHVRESKQRRRDRIRQECFTAYGSQCVCCGEQNFLFLTIDHKNRKGARHRKRLGFSGVKTGTNFYDWLRKHGYPKKNYQCLCFNCNCGRERNGGICPHVAH